MPWRKLLVPSPPSPYEVFLLGLGVMLGLAALMGVQISASIRETVPPWLGQAWGGTLALGSALALAGALATHLPSNAYRHLVLERSGCILVGGGALAYAVATSMNPPDETSHSLYAIGINVAFGLASLWRAGQITFMFRRARKMYGERLRP